MKTILLGFNKNLLTRSQYALVQKFMPEAQIIVTNLRSEMETILDSVEVAAGKIPFDLIPKAANLQWFQQWIAGADWLLNHTEAIEQKFILTNVSGIHAIPTSEHIFALLFSLARRLPLAHSAQSRREWVTIKKESVLELFGKTMLLIGLGNVGKRTLEIAKAMGMRVLGVRRNPTINIEGVEEIVGPDQLYTLLPKADFVVLTIPLTLETKRLIGVNELRAMKPTAYLINIGRGGIIDEVSLIEALQKKWIAGAGLDVFETEPLPKNSPFWKMEEVIVTAHYSGSTPQYQERAMEIFLKNLQRYQTGEQLSNVVNKRLGY